METTRIKIKGTFEVPTCDIGETLEMITDFIDKFKFSGEIDKIDKDSQIEKK